VFNPRIFLHTRSLRFYFNIVNERERKKERERERERGGDRDIKFQIA